MHRSIVKFHLYIVQSHCSTSAALHRRRSRFFPEGNTCILVSGVRTRSRENSSCVELAERTGSTLGARGDATTYLYARGRTQKRRQPHSHTHTFASPTPILRGPTGGTLHSCVSAWLACDDNVRDTESLSSLSLFQSPSRARVCVCVYKYVCRQCLSHYRTRGS